MGKYKEKQYLKILFKYIFNCFFKNTLHQKKKLPYFLICVWINTFVLKFLDYFNALMLKINFFKIFLNKKHFKKQSHNS